ncbi:uncharacterized protein DNG_03398 [Cephalotrichum gorgonifer]|uniref:Zn(2)-C6 fungal-type domain-containing protein n=1 Tax=Cephalotrichum gorgonifer TaxID=2041049 RepID=A0AAE8MUS2_9PEZI|nr:uncharacterized protein DNG_03398 [Cephalotrichum gorgonifer]
MSSTGKGSEDSQVSKENSRPNSRTQLPSLSSLFPHHSARPLHSPALSDRHGSLPAPSPLEQPSRVASAHSDRPPFPSPFFGGSSPHHAAQPRSTYDPRYDSDRNSLHSFQRPLSRTDSPPNDRLRNEPLRHDGLSGSRWPRPLEPAQQEYSLRGREAHPLPSSHSQSPLSYPGARDSASGFHPDSRSSHLPTSSSGAITAATPMQEGLPVKDGLGPKIWTGTHFLPRFVCAAEVPGEGMCYFYDDGSHCKTVIDGEPVNAHWGVTKAGKPRKRLAIACVTCREKKIKCDPDFPRCVQCEKFGRHEEVITRHHQRRSRKTCEDSLARHIIMKHLDQFDTRARLCPHGRSFIRPCLKSRVPTRGYASTMRAILPLPASPCDFRSLPMSTSRA